MCVTCSFKFFHIVALLANTVIFPGITGPFSSLRGPVISSINELLGCLKAKKKKRTRLKSSHLDRTSLVNKGFVVQQKGFASILRESGMTYQISSYGFCNTINSRYSFIPFFVLTIFYRF